jgi:hypothetical protein
MTVDGSGTGAACIAGKSKPSVNGPGLLKESNSLPERSYVSILPFFVRPKMFPNPSELNPNKLFKNWARLIQKIKVDNKARFRYQVGYWFRLIDASICGASAEADTQFTIFL